MRRLATRMTPVARCRGALALAVRACASTSHSNPTTTSVAVLRAHRAATLLPLLEQKRAELGELDARKALCEREAESHAQRGMLFLFAAFALQTAVLFDWTYIHFDWNLVEPITYLLGYSLTWVAIWWYGNLQREFSMDSLRDYVRGRRLERLYAQRGVCPARHRQLREEVGALERRCRALEGV